MRGSGQRLPITLRFTRVLGTFSHTTCFPFSCALWACFSDRSVSGERSEPIGALMPHAALFVVQPRGGIGYVCLLLVSMPHAAIPFRPHHRFAVPLPRSRRGGFSFTARQLLAPMRRMRAAAKSRRSVKGYGILASPADAGERSTSAIHTSFYSCSWNVFPYDLFPVQLCPMGFLLGQVSKWRAQRADRGAHAAHGFVCGAADNRRFSS